ncbi:LOG family protein [Myxococcota bacterium]|nr:LOG family protein [Myxococcota bacterium]
MGTSRRRYESEIPELNDQIEALVGRAREIYGTAGDSDHIRQVIVSALRLMRDGSTTGDSKLVNSSLKELRHAFRVFSPYRNIRKVAVFGSARTISDHPDWTAAYSFSERMAELGWMTITGAGEGIMRAANGGAGRAASFGVNIRLPMEQRANEVIHGDQKLINFRYFFTRKLMFVKEAHAIALFPGGFGTHDEGFEALTLIQTGKSDVLPVIFVDSPGGSYWRDWEEYVLTHLRDRKLIDDEDLALFRVTDDVEEAVQEVVGFYDNYHSSRYVGSDLIIRVQQPPDDAQLEQLNVDFSDLLTSGRIELAPAAQAEVLPRIKMRFNRRNVGRLRQFIDRLNALVSEHSPPDQALPPQVLERPLTPEAEREERD